MMRRTPVRLGVRVAAAAASLAVVAPAAHATGASCDLGDGTPPIADGHEWSEADGFGGWYDYVCQDGTPVFTGWHWTDDPTTVPASRSPIQS